MISLLVTILLAQQQPIQGVLVPPSNERSIVFTDRGRTYRVGTETGRVVFTDGTAPPAPQPDPPGPNLTGFPLDVYRAYMASQVADKPETAALLAHQIDVTLAKAGGLSLDAQGIIDDLSGGITQAGLASRLTGFRLGDLLKTQGDDREAILRALKAVQEALRAVK